MQDNRTIKVVMLGDEGSGKTSLSTRFYESRFPAEYIPTVTSQTSTVVPFERETWKLDIWDTCCRSDHDKFRPLAYPGTNLFIICYSVGSRESFERVLTKWTRELVQQEQIPYVPLFLMGTKKDLRNPALWRKRRETPAVDIVSLKEGMDMAEEIGASGFFECSSLTNQGLEGFFDAVMEIGTKHYRTVRKHGGKGIGRLFRMKKSLDLRRRKSSSSDIPERPVDWKATPADDESEGLRRNSGFRRSGSRSDDDDMSEISAASESEVARASLDGRFPGARRMSADTERPLMMPKRLWPVLKYVSQPACPRHYIEPSHFGSELMALLDDKSYSDVTFCLGGKDGTPFQAHRAILRCGCPAFDRFFGSSATANPGTAQLARTKLCVDGSVSPVVFRYLLEFWYGGTPHWRFNFVTDEGDLIGDSLAPAERLLLKQLQAVARKLSSEALVEICGNVLDDNYMLNASLAAFMTYRAASQFRLQLLGQQLYSDVMLEVTENEEKATIPAHKAVLHARSLHFKKKLQRDPEQTVLPLGAMDTYAVCVILQYIYTDVIIRDFSEMARPLQMVVTQGGKSESKNELDYLISAIRVAYTWSLKRAISLVVSEVIRRMEANPLGVSDLIRLVDVATELDVTSLQVRCLYELALAYDSSPDDPAFDSLDPSHIDYIEDNYPRPRRLARSLSSSLRGLDLQHSPKKSSLLKKFFFQ
eukprot:Rmarinus@m.3150